MGNYLNPGNEKFRRMIQSEIYVDKTGMIKYTNSVLETAQNYVCVSRPRRFGKSMAANMLTAYYSRGCNSKELFGKFEIAKDKYPAYTQSNRYRQNNHLLDIPFSNL